MSETRIPAVILGGGKPGDPLAESFGVPYKALVPVEGRPMVAHVADALSRSATVSDVRTLAPAEVSGALPGLRSVADTGSFLGNVLAAAEACGEAPYCLIATCDIPFVTPEAIDAFVRGSVARGCDLSYPFVEFALCKERFPQMTRTSVKLREGRLTGGNAVVVRPGFLKRNEAAIEGAFAARKAPVKLAAMLGIDLIIRLVLAQALPPILSLRSLEKRVGRLVGGTAAGIVLPYPEIGADVDRPGDLRSSY